MVTTIADALRRIKDDLARVLEPAMLAEVCRALGHQWRDRLLDPVTTIHLFVLQVLHGNTACAHVPHLSEKDRKSTRLNSSHSRASRMPSSA